MKIPEKGLKKILSFRWRVGLPIALGLIILGSVALTLFMFYLEPGSFKSAMSHVAESKFTLFFLNWAPIILSMLFVYFLLGNVVLSCGIPGLIVILVSIVNRNKIEMRADPFKPLDIFMGGEVAGIARSIDKSVFLSAGLLLGTLTLLMALALVFVRNKKMKWYVRAAGALGAAGVFLLVNGLFLSDKKIYDGFAVYGNRYNLVDNFQSKGFLYSFIHTWDTQKITKPPNYDADRAVINEKVDGFVFDETLSSKEKPNIIMILGEAFSEFAASEAVSFEGYDDPLENYKRIKAESVSGSIIVPDIGGGTANTEFDIFTGVSTRHFRDNPYSFSIVNKPYAAMPEWLGKLGYGSLTLHPGYGWFYNRRNAYPLLGFDRFLSIDDLGEIPTKGMYATEDVTIERIIEYYAEHAAANPEQPFFEFCITIQNHGPYIDKYGAGQNFAPAADFSAEEVNALSNYFEGVKDADRGIKNLTDYLNGLDEPVALVYFGDHAPSFVYDIYGKVIPALGTDYDSQTRLYRAPFFVWPNRAARGLLDNGAVENFGGDVSMSANYFGAWVTRLLGFGGVDPWADYLNELSAKYPVLLESEYAKIENGERIFAPIDDAPADIGLYRSWEYFIVKGS